MLIFTQKDKEYKGNLKQGSMAELVDAPDSKSGHFGGMGSIPSTFTDVN